MDKKRLGNLVIDEFGVEPVSLENCGINELLSTEKKARVNIIALGDVGTNVLMGLKLLGGDVISEIGIYDLNEPQLQRLEMEFNQMHYPPMPQVDSRSESGCNGAHDSDTDSDKADDYPHPRAACLRDMPEIKIISSDEELLDCDVLIFCATKSVPEIGAKGDMRMMQLEANLGLIKIFGEKIRASRENAISKESETSDNGDSANILNPKGFNGLVAVVSDPVDQLCKGMLDSSGLEPGQVRGFGLGVMAARARYYAKKLSADNATGSTASCAADVDTNTETNTNTNKAAAGLYLTEGRGFGPHGQDLVIANSIENYDDDVSRELTKLTVEANLRVRDLGFKPFLAPAISSAAISIILTLRGEWNYGSVFFGCADAECRRDSSAATNAECCDDSATAGNAQNVCGAFVGCLSRLTKNGVKYEDLELPENLYARILAAYRNLLA